VPAPFAFPTPDELTAVTGLEFMQGVLSGRFPKPPMADTLGYALSAVSAGRAVFVGAPRETYCNPMGGVHGGWYGTLLDSAMGCAVMTTLPKGRLYTTLEYKINITRALPLGTEIEAVGEVDHAGRTTAVAHGEIRGVADGRLYATGTTTCLIMAA